MGIASSRNCLFLQKLDGYFGKFTNAEITALQVQGDFGDNLGVRKVTKTKNRRLWSKMGKSKAIVSDMKDTIRNTFVKMANALSGCEGDISDIAKLREVGICFN